MADSSQYLAQAIQQMQQDPTAPAQPAQPAMSADQMQQMHQAKQAFDMQHTGMSHLAFNLQRAGQNLMGAPGRVADAVGGVAQLPGQAMSGLQALAQRFGGGGLPPTTTI